MNEKKDEKTTFDSRIKTKLTGIGKSSLRVKENDKVKI